MLVQPAVLTQLPAQLSSRPHPYGSLSDAKFAKVVRRAKLQNFQGDVLLELLKDEDFKPDELTIHSTNQLREVQRTSSDRAAFQTIKVSDGIGTFDLFTRNIVDLALELFEDPQFADSISLGFQLEVIDGSRVYEEFWTGDWFKVAQVNKKKKKKILVFQKK